MYTVLPATNYKIPLALLAYVYQYCHLANIIAFCQLLVQLLVNGRIILKLSNDLPYHGGSPTFSCRGHINRCHHQRKHREDEPVAE